jgi:hypothetical protein
MSINMSHSRRRVGLATVVLALAAVGLSVPAAYADDTTGTISGHFTRDGQPVTPGNVFAFSDDTGEAFFAPFDEQGGFTVADLEPGLYRVAFDDATTNLRQWAYQKLTFSDADLVEVIAGQVTTVDEAMLPSGTLAGTVTDAHGQPAPGVEVRAHLADEFSGTYAQTFTDPDGRWQLGVAAADYKISFVHYVGGDTFVEQWARQQPSEWAADVFTVGVGYVATVDEGLLPVGSISGRFTDPDGNAVVEGNVNISDVAGNHVEHAGTDETGAYSFPALLAGSYVIEFATPDWSRIQYAHAKPDRESADPILVEGGQNTVVDEQLLAGGSIQVRAKDARTGKAIPDICVQWMDTSVCAEAGGVATIDGVPPGQQFVNINVSDGRYFNEGAEVTVVSGETVEVVVRLHRAASLVTQIRDRASGAPVENACVSLVNPDTPRGLGNERSFCSDDTGKVVVGPTDAGSFKLFVRPTDGVHGMQWVGVGGGTGRFEEARVVRLKTGKPVALPAIEVDQAGSVAGVVTSASTGEPLPFGLVTLASFSPGVGPGFSADTNEEGRYVFDGLGPYEWPLLFSRFEYASQWTGGTADRRLATPIAVTAGQETAYDVAMTTGTTYTGTVLTTAGAPIKGGFVIAHNVATREITGSAWIDNGQYTLRLLGPQDVRIEVQGGAGEDWYNSWYVAAIDFKHATTVAVPASGGLTLDIVALPSTT